jgi:S1-C subfamily serine protease
MSDNFGTQLSDNIAALVEANASGVVMLHARRRGPSTGALWQDGVIITASHTVEREESIPVALPGGVEVSANLAGRDPSTNLAVLKIDARGISAPKWGAADGLKVGHLVLAIGRGPNGASAALGLVSTLGEAWRTHTGGRVDRWIETDLGPYPGFSGSLLVDLRGRVLGLNTSGLVRGASLVIPTATLERVVGSLLSRGHVQRAFLGVTTQPVRLPAPLRSHGREGGALLVMDVAPDGPAAKGGLFLGDLLTAIEGQPVSDIGELLSLLEEDRIGKEVTVQIIRGGEPKQLKVTLGARGRS